MHVLWEGPPIRAEIQPIEAVVLRLRSSACLLGLCGACDETHGQQDLCVDVLEACEGRCIPARRTTERLDLERPAFTHERGDGCRGRTRAHGKQCLRVAQDERLCLGWHRAG